MSNTQRNFIDLIKFDPEKIKSKNVTIGFDGFVDKIMRVVRSKKSKEEFTLFQSMAEFGSYIVSKKGKSCCLELNEQIVKIGGNMPIMAMALGKYGFNVNCIGAMGFPKQNHLFNSMITNNCKLYSIAEPGETVALEFDDGKVMLAMTNMLDDITWNRIKEIVGFEKIKDFFMRHDLIGMVNWSEVENLNSIWESIICEILPYHQPNKSQMMFFDIADCSKRSKSDIRYALDLIGAFAEHYKVILGVNQNEAGLIYEALYCNEFQNVIEKVGDKLFQKLNIDMLIIHTRNCSIAWDKTGSYKIKNKLIQLPKITTGAGDNFNAGFCAAQLLEMDIISSLIIANATASFYISNGYSPNIEQLKAFLLDWTEQIDKKGGLFCNLY